MEQHTWVWKATFVAVRILATYLIARAVILAASQAGILSTPGFVRWWVVIAILGTAAVGAGLWQASDRVADRVAEAAELPNETPDVAAAKNPGIDPLMALRLGMKLIGIVIFTDGFAGLLFTIGFVSSAPSEALGFTRTPYYWQMASEAVQIALGIWLFSGAKGLPLRLGPLGRVRIPPPDSD